MRIVTWNMGCGPRVSQYRRSHNEAWEYLVKELRPDVAMVQEALVSNLEEARSSHTVTVCRLGPSVVAGTAVLTRALETATAPTIAVSEHTYAVTTKVNTAAGAFTAVSVHVYPGEEHHADLERLVELLRATLRGRRVLVGGDFNAARRFDAVYGGQKHQRFFTAMERAGFHEAHWGVHGREVQSFWGRQTKESYQDDHFFLSSEWQARVRSCDVVDNESVRRLSDHGPVVLELDVD